MTVSFLCQRPPLPPLSIYVSHPFMWLQPPAPPPPHTPTHMNTHTHTHICTHKHRHTQTHSYLPARIHTHTHICTLTHTNTHTHTLGQIIDSNIPTNTQTHTHFSGAWTFWGWDMSYRKGLLSIRNLMLCMASPSSGLL